MGTCKTCGDTVTITDGFPVESSKCIGCIGQEVREEELSDRRETPA